MGILDLCNQYFGTSDIYKLLEVEKDVPIKDIKKAYYKLSLQVHPDRVSEAEKPIATEKFKVLSKIYQVLIDKDKRALYDEQSIIDDEDDVESKCSSWLDLWRKIFMPLTVEDIDNYQKNYIGSELERSDIKKAYLSSKGCINNMMDEVPFLGVEDEPRLQEIVKEMIAAKEVPEFKIFTNEPAQKRKRRHNKYARESKLAEEIKKGLDVNKNESLEQQIMQRQKSRRDNYESLLEKLAEKYGDDNETGPVFSLGNATRKKSKKPKPTKKTNPVKNGKVKKRSN